VRPETALATGVTPKQSFIIRWDDEQAFYVITLFWQKAEKSRWRAAVEKGFAPLTVGLILATSLVMRAGHHDK
jgi:hypothetical protein